MFRNLKNENYRDFEQNFKEAWKKFKKSFEKV